MLQNCRISLAIAAVSVIASSCGTGRASFSVQGENRVTVNGEAVPTTGEENLLAVLRRKASAYRLGEQSSPDDQPLVLVDGVAMMDGARSLNDIPASHVQSVTLLRPAAAVPAYGSRARKGAIVIKTRRGH